MPTVTSTIDDLSACIGNGKLNLIAIDGFHASGKTTLAKQLSDRYELPIVSADNYLNRNQGSYFNQLRLLEIASSISQSPQCIFEGICALQILDAINIKPDLLIYVKRMALWGWADEDHLERPDSRATQQQTVDLVPLESLQIAIGGLREEVVTYHLNYQPHLVANYVFERTTP